MKPNDKARELLLMYYVLIPMNTISFAKQCVLILLDEMIKEKTECSKYECYGEDIRFWQEVKNELENL